MAATDRHRVILVGTAEVQQRSRDKVGGRWAGLAAPPGTLRRVPEKPAAQLKEVMALPALQERDCAAASTSGTLFLDDMPRFVRTNAEAWRPLLAQLWLKAPISPLWLRGRSAVASSNRSAARAASCIA